VIRRGNVPTSRFHHASKRFRLADPLPAGPGSSLAVVSQAHRPQLPRPCWRRAAPPTLRPELFEVPDANCGPHSQTCQELRKICHHAGGSTPYKSWQANKLNIGDRGDKAQMTRRLRLPELKRSDCDNGYMVDSCARISSAIGCRDFASVAPMRLKPIPPLAQVQPLTFPSACSTIGRF